MAALSSGDRLALRDAFMRVAENILGATYTKADLQAAVNAADDWADSNTASFNSALPVATRNGMTTKQKTLLLSYVILKRAGVL